MAKFRIVYKNTSLEAPLGEFLVGRSAECHLVLDDPSVSRVHFSIVHEDERLFVEDKGSRNGVLVNAERVEGRQELSHGDHIEVGHQRIRVVALDRVQAANKTQGLTACSSCGAWVAAGDRICSKCGAGLSQSAPPRGKETIQDMGNALGGRAMKSSVIEPQPISMLAMLARKSIHVRKLEDAEHLTGNAIKASLSKVDKGGYLSDDEFAVVTETLVELAEAAGSAEQLSRLFQFHRMAGRLISRDLVESLYNVVRTVGYRACPELATYLAFLDTKAEDFSPGERFIHRRLQGLVSICS